MDLRTCSLAARGLWIEMLCVMSEAEPRGYLLRRGRPVGMKELSVFAGTTVEIVERLVKELDQAGVFSRTPEGTIFSRRMVRDEENAARSRANGAKGGNPALKASVDEKQRLTEIQVNPKDLFEVAGDDKTQKPEARVQKEGNLTVPCPKRVRTRRQYTPDFEAFWEGYPTDSNMSKAEAFAEWERLTEDERRDATVSLPAFRGYCTSHPDYRPIHANRYLSKRRWEGHLKTATAVQQRVFVGQGSPQWDAWCRYYRATKGTSPPVDDRGGWNFPSEWPPKMAQSAA